MADDNKPLKYMRYAIGEIVLVVIGILIALQINNWNEERKQRKSEIQFLKRLKSDLFKDNQYFIRRLNESEEVVKLHIIFISELYEEQKNITDVKDLFKLLRPNSELLITQNSTYSEMIYSARLDIIHNEILKNNLVNYYHENEQVGKHIKEFNEFSVESWLQMIRHVPYLERVIWWNYSSEFYDQKNFDFKRDWDFLNDFNSPKFQNVEQTISIYRNKHQIFSEYFKKLIQRNEILINAVQNELDK